MTLEPGLKAPGYLIILLKMRVYGLGRGTVRAKAIQAAGGTGRRWFAEPLIPG